MSHRSVPQAPGGPTHAELLARWESYRAEIEDMERRMKALAFNFLELNDFESASRCAIRAEGMRFVRGRMPPAHEPAAI